MTGYDLVGNTPFDITNEVVLRKENEVAIRITAPNGNFDWRESQNFKWGDYGIIPGHGFEDITEKVLIAKNNIFS